VEGACDGIGSVEGECEAAGCDKVVRVWRGVCVGTDVVLRGETNLSRYGSPTKKNPANCIRSYITAIRS